MERKKLERVITICKKKIASAKEILDGCSGVFEVYINETEKGIISVSISTDNKYLAMCIWREKENEQFEKLAHLTIPKRGLLSLEGYVREAITLNRNDAVNRQ